jgi:hypothetical protein
MYVIVDTNVAIVANNNESPQASPDCVINCVRRLRQIQKNEILVLDDPPPVPLKKGEVRGINF